MADSNCKITSDEIQNRVTSCDSTEKCCSDKCKLSVAQPLSVNGNRNKFIVRVTLIRGVTEKRTDICTFTLLIFIMLNRLRGSRDELDDINHGSISKCPLAAGSSRKVTLTSRKLETKMTSPSIHTDAADKSYMQYKEVSQRKLMQIHKM